MNPLFQMMNGQTQGRSQNTNFNTAMHQLRENPAEMVKQAGYQIPDGMGNDPQAMVMHLIQSGQVGGPMMQRIQPMINQLMNKR